MFEFMDMCIYVYMYDWVSIKFSEYIGYVELELYIGFSEMFF